MNTRLRVLATLSLVLVSGQAAAIPTLHRVQPTFNQAGSTGGVNAGLIVEASTSLPVLVIGGGFTITCNTSSLQHHAERFRTYSDFFGPHEVLLIPDVVPSVEEIRAKFNRRREAANPVERVVRRLLGIEAKLRQWPSSPGRGTSSKASSVSHAAPVPIGDARSGEGSDAGCVACTSTATLRTPGAESAAPVRATPARLAYIEEMSQRLPSAPPRISVRP